MIEENDKYIFESNNIVLAVSCTVCIYSMEWT